MVLLLNIKLFLHVLLNLKQSTERKHLLARTYLYISPLSMGYVELLLWLYIYP